MSTPRKSTYRTLEKNLYEDLRWGTRIARKRVNGEPVYGEFAPGTPVARMRQWLKDQEAKVRRASADVGRGTLRADKVEYLKPGGPANLSTASRKRRDQRLEWWCAQLAAIGAPVLSVEAWQAETAARKAGHEIPSRGTTLGELSRHLLEPERLREILTLAFPTLDDDPARHASTSNHYRLALWHLCAVLDQDDPHAVNPLKNVPIRQGADPNPDAGIDMRLVREVLTHAPARFGKDSAITQRRVDVLAWVHIRETQLMKVKPLRDFHDVPDATREDILAGAITLTVQPHFKGRKNRRLPAPQTIPLTPWGVEAMRAFIALPAAWGDFSMSPLNKFVKRGARRAQAGLARRGYVVDLSTFTAKHLRHSLGTAVDLATGGLVDRFGSLKMDPGVVAALGHAEARTSRIYTQAAVKPHMRRANLLTTLYLEALLKEPLVPTPLRLVAQAGQ